MTAEISTRVFKCYTCGHPLNIHGNDPRSIGCPPDRFRFTFQIGDEQIHETVGSVGLARATARALASNRNAPVRWIRHGKRIAYSWEVS